MARRSDTRQRMLDIAANLLHAQGYHATGLNQILSESGTPRGSLYFHFPGGKQELAAEALALSGSRLCTLIEGILAHAPGPEAAIDSLIESLGDNLIATEFRGGCPLATAALDAAADSEAIRQACEQGYQGWRVVIERYLGDQGLDSAAANQLSAVIIASLEGGLLLAKTHHDLAPLRAVGAHLRSTIVKELP